MIHALIIFAILFLSHKLDGFLTTTDLACRTPKARSTSFRFGVAIGGDRCGVREINETSFDLGLQSAEKQSRMVSPSRENRGEDESDFETATRLYPTPLRQPISC